MTDPATIYGTPLVLNGVPRQTIALAPSKNAACRNDADKNQTTRLARLYLETPAPDHAPVIKPAMANAPKPPASSAHPFRWLSPRAWRVWRARERAQRAAYEKALARWSTARRAHTAMENCRSAAVKVAARGDVFAMEYALEVALTAIDWPGRADVDCDVVDPSTLLMDVRLSSQPATQHPPAVPAAALRLVEDSNKQPGSSDDQPSHVASAAFRLLGEAFHHLPTLETVEMMICEQPNRKAALKRSSPAPVTLHVGRARFARLYEADLSGHRE